MLWRKLSSMMNLSCLKTSLKVRGIPVSKHRREVVAILHRVPANVIGDGVSSIEDLVAEKNKNPLRGKGYMTPLEKISLGPVEVEFLRLQDKDVKTVLQQGETAYLRENSNISTGGDSIDFTDDINEEYKSIAASG